LDVPALPPGVTFADIDAGGALTAARLSDGSFETWGGNTMSPWSLPTAPPGSTYSDVAVGGEYALWSSYYWDPDPVWGGCTFQGTSNWPLNAAVALLDDGSLVDWTGSAASWTFGNLGYGLAGSSGVPSLGAGISGSPFATTFVSVGMSGALPISTATLVISLGEIDLPFKGGMLVPSPDLLLHGLLTDSGGNLSLSGWLPTPSIPPGSTFYFQYWIADAAGPFGLSASNGFSITTP
ncbi:MAG: hypothetical protein ACYTG2_18560, partial [Planctomycetota bacterium]